MCILIISPAKTFNSSSQSMQTWLVCGKTDRLYSYIGQYLESKYINEQSTYRWWYSDIPLLNNLTKYCWNHITSLLKLGEALWIQGVSQNDVGDSLTSRDIALLIGWEIPLHMLVKLFIGQGFLYIALHCFMIGRG